MQNNQTGFRVCRDLDPKHKTGEMKCRRGKKYKYQNLHPQPGDWRTMYSSPGERKFYQRNAPSVEPAAKMINASCDTPYDIYAL